MLFTVSPPRPQNPNTVILRRHLGELLCPYVYLLIYFLASVTFNVQILGPLLQTAHLFCPISLWIPWNPSVFLYPTATNYVPSYKSLLHDQVSAEMVRVGSKWSSKLSRPPGMKCHSVLPNVSLKCMVLFVSET